MICKETGNPNSSFKKKLDAEIAALILRQAADEILKNSDTFDSILSEMIECLIQEKYLRTKTFSE